jgi:putative PIN family toxin of toxin-antitoxin system
LKKLDKKDISAENKIYKVIIDTNIWVSFLIGNALKGLLDYILNEKIVVFTCMEQLTELSLVIKKTKLKKYFSIDKISILFNFLEEYATVIPVSTKIDLCRDKKDNYLLSLATDSKADYLITGDNDLLVLKNINGTEIINFSLFKSLFTI